MKITWIGHSCFRLEEDGYSVVLDPYENGTVPGLTNMQENAYAALCSHDQFDHNAAGNVTIVRSGEKPFKVTSLPTYHDEVKGAKRGNNLIHIIETERTKVVHLGDLGCDPEAEQKALIAGCDVLLIPVGGFYTIDAKQAAELTKELKPRVAIPMHYRSDEAGFGFDKIGTVDPFVAAFTNVRISTESSFDTDEPAPAEIVVLQPQNQASDFGK